MIEIDFAAAHRLASVGSLVGPLRRVFASRAVSPERAHYDLPGPNPARRLLLMPSWRAERGSDGDAGGIGVKIVTVFPENGTRGLPSVNGAYLLLSGLTGEPRGWIDGRALTLLRTAAVSALAADLLAPANPEQLLMVGTGALSRYLIEGHLAVRNYASVLVWGRDSRKAAAVAEELRARDWPITVADDLEAAARSATVISCATLADKPLIQGRWLRSGTHLDLVGSFRPDMREADDACLTGAFITVDTPSALRESGDLADPLARGAIAAQDIATLGDVIAAAPGSPRRRTVFKSVGVAHADLAVAEELCARHSLGA
jgi:ornithine cyclodeaminase